jgi:hypothetical protein
MKRGNVTETIDYLCHSYLEPFRGHRRNYLKNYNRNGTEHPKDFRGIIKIQPPPPPKKK